MRKILKTLIVTSALVAGIATAPALYAQSTENTPGTQVPPMSQGNMPCQDNMMGQGNMPDQGNMMGQGSMMNMMGQMNQMMEAHTKMMQSMLKAHGTAQPDAE